MEKYIKAAECAEIISDKMGIPLHDLVDVFAEVPTSDVVEVKRGEWIEKQQTVRMGDMIITGTYPTCNLCGQAEIGMVKQTNFCPNCGADMREINEKKEV